MMKWHHLISSYLRTAEARPVLALFIFYPSSGTIPTVLTDQSSFFPDTIPTCRTLSPINTSSAAHRRRLPIHGEISLPALCCSYDLLQFPSLLLSLRCCANVSFRVAYFQCKASFSQHHTPTSSHSLCNASSFINLRLVSHINLYCAALISRLSSILFSRLHSFAQNLRL